MTVGATVDHLDNLDGLFGREARNEIGNEDGENRADRQTGFVSGIPEIIFSPHLAKVALPTETGSCVQSRKRKFIKKVFRETPLPLSPGVAHVHGVGAARHLVVVVDVVVVVVIIVVVIVVVHWQEKKAKYSQHLDS